MYQVLDLDSVSPSECCLLEPTNEDSYIDRKYKYEQAMVTVMEGNDEKDDFEDK